MNPWEENSYRQPCQPACMVQSELVMAEIRKILPEADLELVTMKTTGDKILHKTLDKIGGKGLFLKELDAALFAGQVDICVHSLKDVPVTENPALPIGAYSVRELPADVLVLPKGTSHWNPALPVGCASARRRMQFQQLYPEAVIQPVRGNVLTRLEKLDSGEYGALILAEAGLKRLGCLTGSPTVFHRRNWCRRQGREFWRYRLVPANMPTCLPG